MKVSQILNINSTNKMQNRQNKQKGPSFASSTLQSFSNLTIVSPYQPLDVPNWIKDPIIFKAMNYLEGLDFDKEDVKYVQSLGVMPPFLNGKDAVDFINNSNTRIKFATLSSVNIHAQYDFDSNFIMINDIYKNTQNPAEILAIASAILHEAGHAKDKDPQSSIQEEIDCLAMNVLAHRAFSKKFPNVFSSSDALIIKDGTTLYSNLFFDADPAHLSLINRLNTKYGFLPAGDFNHPPSNIAIRSKDG